MPQVAFLGLGTMGRRMARRLLDAGHQLTVYNRSQGVVDEFAALGARRAATPQEAAAGSEFLFTCLPTADVVQEVLFGPDGAIHGLGAASVCVDHSTIGPSQARALAARCAEHGVTFLDAPVSGGPWGAEAGTLSIMAGGDAAAFQRALPVLQAMGQRIYHVGPSGAGAVAKLCNNMLVAIHNAAAAEAMVLGAKAGVDPSLLYEILSNATGQSAMLQRNVPRFILPGDFTAAFSIDLLDKDMHLMQDLARQLDLQLPLSETAVRGLDEAQAAGLGSRDVSAVILPLEEQAGIRVRRP